MISVLGAFALLSFLVLSVNTTILEKTEVILDTEASITSISLAQAMVDEIQSKEFDQKCIGVRIYNASDMTSSGSLGCDAGETLALPDTLTYLSTSRFNDVDDYNGYRRTVRTHSLDDFVVVDSVYYVSNSDPNQKSSTQTFYKKIVVKITNPVMKQPVILTDITVYRRYI